MRVLVGIVSAHCHGSRRWAQRHTWMLNAGVDIKFVLGRPGGSESDVLYVECRDSPTQVGGRWTEVLRAKHEALIAHTLEAGYEYLFKCDDDSYVNVPALLNSGFEQHDYSGCTERHNADDIGDYLWCPTAFWLSRRAMEIIRRDGLTRHPADDTCVGQTLSAAGITAFQDDRFYPSLPSSIPDDAIMLHKCDPETMQEVHRKVTNTPRCKAQKQGE